MKKETIKKEIPEEVKSGVRFVSFKMSAIIRTGEYQSVTPEIFVEGGSLDEAEEIVTSHIDALMAKYKDCMVVKPVVRAVTPAVAVVPLNKVQERSVTTNPIIPEASVNKSFTRAEQAIESAKTPEALALVRSQVDISGNLNVAEKKILIDKINQKEQAK